MAKPQEALRELKALYRVSQAVSASLDLGEVMGAVLAILAEELGMQRGTLAAVDPETGELVIEVAHGLTEVEVRRGRYKVGEGIMGRVLETGEPIAVPSIGDEPLFLNRTGARRDLDRYRVAFLCVPVKVRGETVGVLSADRLSEEGLDLEEDLRLLTTVAGVVSQAVRIQLQLRREKAALAAENRHLRRALEGAYRLENLVGTSPGMVAVYEQVKLVARGRTPVLITGERGAGKETVAKAIHFNSDRAQGPFVRLACAGAPEAILAAELFGDGASGRVEQAEGGTLFLDDVAALPPAVQEALLRLVQDREFRPGSGGPLRRADVRLVAATADDLAAEVRAGRFRDDLFRRLHGVPIHLPPLRDRKGDVALLAHHFLQRFARDAGKELRGFAPEAVAALSAHSWPGNVQELEGAVARGVAVARGDLVELEDLPPWVLGPAHRPSGNGGDLEAAVVQVAGRFFDRPPAEGVHRAVLDRVERVLIDQAMARCGGVRLQAARLLGINRNTLYARLERMEHP